MNRLLLFYTEWRWATSSNYLYLTTFKAFCSLLPLFLPPSKAISVSVVLSPSSLHLRSCSSTTLQIHLYTTNLHCRIHLEGNLCAAWIMFIGNVFFPAKEV